MSEDSEDPEYSQESELLKESKKIITEGQDKLLTEKEKYWNLKISRK